jgi:uncharacterized MAPEG superfamily protein
MPIELSYLSASVALFFVYLLGEVVTGNMQYKPKDLLGPRDNLPPQNTAVGRAKRATSNMLESLIMFAPLVLIAAYTNRFNEMTALGAAIFFWARVAYAPSYWFGLPVVRSLIWAVGLIGMGMIFLQVLPFSGAR